MSNTLVGLSNHINEHFHKIATWAKSFMFYCPEGRVVLICANATEEEIQRCKDIGIEVISVKVEDERTINHQRLYPIKNFLESEPPSDNLYLITDVFDVVFQRDPFEQWNLQEYDVFVSEEGIDVHEEPWNFSNISGLFPNDFNLCLHHPIICSGVIGGKRDALISLYDRMFYMCEHESTDAHNIKDQAALIVLLARNEIPRVQIFKLKDAWTVHCAVAGPTQFFESWGFKNKLERTQTPIPYMEECLVKSDGKPFAIVHQFNRIPEWNSVLTKPYN